MNEALVKCVVNLENYVIENSRRREFFMECFFCLMKIDRKRLLKKVGGKQLIYKEVKSN